MRRVVGSILLMPGAGIRQSAAGEAIAGCGLACQCGPSRYEPVDLTGPTLAGGRAMTHSGGGIYLAGSASLRLERGWLTDNLSFAAGGGIAAYNPIVLLDSAVSHNCSAEDGGGIIGGEGDPPC